MIYGCSFVLDFHSNDADDIFQMILLSRQKMPTEIPCPIISTHAAFVVFAPFPKGGEGSRKLIGRCLNGRHVGKRLHGGVNNSQNEHKHHGRIVRTPAPVQIVANHVSGTQQEVQEGGGQRVLLHIPDIKHLCKDRTPAQPDGVGLLTAIGAEVSLVFMSATQALVRLANHRLEMKGIALPVTEPREELLQFHHFPLLFPTFIRAMPIIIQMISRTRQMMLTKSP